MPRGYQCIVIAAVGWLALCAQHPNPSAKDEQAKSAPRVGDALSNNAATYREQTEPSKRVPEPLPCGPAQYQSNDDLCAQWKAADAAEKAAWWAAFAGWFGGLSFLGVLAAIGLAFHSNWIARDTARRQLRAYIAWDGVTMEHYRDEEGRVLESRFQLTWKNGGQTPAVNFIGDLNWCITDGDLPSEFDYPEGPGDANNDRLVVGPQATVISPAKVKITVEEFVAAGRKEKRVHLWAWAEYSDVFGSRHRTEVGVEVEIEALKDGGHDVRFNSTGPHNGMDSACMRKPRTKQH